MKIILAWTLKMILALALLSGLCSLPALADDSGADTEAPLVKDGVLGTVNVLRELDVKTGKNRVTVKGAADFSRDWGSGPIESTIDGSGVSYLPATDPKHWVATYTLPGLRTVSSFAIVYDGNNFTAPDTVRLEGSGDGGKTWFKVFMTRPRNNSTFVKCFKPAKVNELRLTQEGGNPRTGEVVVYADPEVPLPLFAGKDSGAFSFLRDLWYRGKIKLTKNPPNGAWGARGWGGKPHVPFVSEFLGAEGAMCFGLGKQQGGGNRQYVLLDLDEAYPMNYGLISGDGAFVIAAKSQAEVYTANGKLDPSKLKGNSIQDLTGQGWILQKAWDKDPSPCKGFLLNKPGKYNQILVVWENNNPLEGNRWSHLEMFGSQEIKV